MREKTRDNIKTDDGQMNYGWDKKMNNQFYFTDRAFQKGFILILDSYHMSHANSKLNTQPILPEFGFERRYINRTLKEMAAFFYAVLISEYVFKYQTVFSARFDQQEQYED